MAEAHTAEDETRGKELRIDADRQFKAGNYAFAIDTYAKAAELSLSPKLALSVNTNMAIAHSKLGDYGACRARAARCLEIDPGYVRGYFWKAMSEVYLRLFQEATDTFNQGLKLDPKNKDILARLRFLEFCKLHQEFIVKFHQKDWLEIEDAVNGNLKFCSEENFAREMTKMTKRRKNGAIICISSAVCNYYGKIVSMEIPNHAFSDKQKEINMKLKMGDYTKLYLQITISDNPDGTKAYLYKVQTVENTKLNDLQTYAIDNLETTANSTETLFNPHYNKLLFDSVGSEQGATPN